MGTEQRKSAQLLRPASSALEVHRPARSVCAARPLVVCVSLGCTAAVSATSKAWGASSWARLGPIDVSFPRGMCCFAAALWVGACAAAPCGCALCVGCNMRSGREGHIWSCRLKQWSCLSPRVPVLGREPMMLLQHHRTGGHVAVATARVAASSFLTRAAAGRAGWQRGQMQWACVHALCWVQKVHRRDLQVREFWCTARAWHKDSCRTPQPFVKQGLHVLRADMPCAHPLARGTWVRRS